jgi:hypothetical protein
MYCGEMGRLQAGQRGMMSDSDDKGYWKREFKSSELIRLDLGTD